MNVLEFKHELVARSDNLRRYIQRRIPVEFQDRLGPDDVLQDVLRTAFVRLRTEGLPEIQSFDEWLISITHNRLVSALRIERAAKRGGRAQFVRHPPQNSSLLELLQEMTSATPSPSRDVAAEESRELVRSAMESLPGQEKDAIRRHYIEGHSYQQIANDMSIAIPAVRGLLGRALRRLRSLLRDPRRFFSDVKTASTPVEPWTSGQVT